MISSPIPGQWVRIDSTRSASRPSEIRRWPQLALLTADAGRMAAPTTQVKVVSSSLPVELLQASSKFVSFSAMLMIWECHSARFWRLRLRVNRGWLGSSCTLSWSLKVVRRCFNLRLELLIKFAIISEMSLSGLMLTMRSNKLVIIT